MRGQQNKQWFLEVKNGVDLEIPLAAMKLHCPYTLIPILVVTRVLKP